MLDPKLLEILACPACKTKLDYDEAGQKLTCTKCHKKYPVRDGIPIMLESEAES